MGGWGLGPGGEFWGSAATAFSLSVAGSARPQLDISPDTETSPTHTQHRENPETQETSLPAIYIIVLTHPLTTAYAAPEWASERARARRLKQVS